MAHEVGIGFANHIHGFDNNKWTVVEVFQQATFTLLLICLAIVRVIAFFSTFTDSTFI
jgi:hypothetical protein